MASLTRWTESQWTPGVGDGQGGLACCNSWGRKESDTTERLIWSDLSIPESLASSFFLCFFTYGKFYFDQIFSTFHFLAPRTLFSFWHFYFDSPWLSFYHELLSSFILSLTIITKVASVSFWYLHHLLTVLFYLLSIWYQIISTCLILLSYFYWNIVALQCCVGFYCIAKWISHIYTHIPLPFGLPSHSSHHSALNCVSCAIQHILISYLFYT